ncbi:DUF5994 family protein [Mycobacterium sp. 663a-19]|uniref:DUF5994 family protein n=1 Tax=Mycobacterium sp. 663a-19 TaxID=2986148 RepID=UPI002D1E6FFA|nr:DUF5994 family protein [Mycobacterium sp. 663a-19]MEB3979729.1 DUF5994 family protein [Mycobacterium sp. 663a-19]
MSATTEHIGAALAHRSAFGTLRLRFKSAHRTCGFVQGAWWPQSTRLSAELPSLLAALSLRFGVIDRVRYHQSDWSSAPSSLKHLGGDVILDASQDSPNVITVFGKKFGKLDLLVVPPYTRPSEAYTAMATAVSVDDASTPDQLLGINEHSAKNRDHARMALQRWESDGGALPALAPARPQIHGRTNQSR